MMKSVRSSMSLSANIYHSLDSVLKALTPVREAPEVRELLSTCANEGILEVIDGKYLASVATDIQKEKTVPFVVIEGLDGSGKTSISAEVQRRYRMRPMMTPPEVLLKYRKFFDLQPESIRRAYYSLGNYLAAENVLRCTEPVIMDRFWHSTAAYALGNEIQKNTDNIKIDQLNLVWPGDLLQPNLVLFLYVTEAERIRRHSTRLVVTNTVEEQSLANDQAFRENIVSIFRQIRGPQFLEINADGTKEEVQHLIFKTVEEAFPALNSRVT